MNAFALELLEGARPELDTFIARWGHTIPLLRRLEDTPQDPKWHAEGNVRIHTERVLQEVFELLDHEAAGLPAEEQLALVLAAVLHDIGKALTTRTRIIDGQERIISPRHAERGRSNLALRLPELGLPKAVDQHVMSLVGHHHDPRKAVSADRPESYRRVASLARPDLLRFLEQADLRGRDCPDLAGELETLELFRLGCEDAGVWSGNDWMNEWREQLGAHFSKASPHRLELLAGRAYREHVAGRCRSIEVALARLHSLADEGRGAELVITVGPAGSGKSRWVHRSLPEARVLSMDEIRGELTGSSSDQRRNGEVFQMAKERLKQALRKPGIVVWEATALRRDSRIRLLEIGEAYGALVRFVCFRTPLSVLLDRNRKRSHPLPEAGLLKQLETMEWPFADEADVVEVLEA